MCINTCRTEARRQRRSLPWIDTGTASEPRAANDFQRVVDYDQLERGFKRLSVEHRAVLVLHHYLGMPLEQIATTLDIPLGTVKSRMHRALQQMRRSLEADAAPGPRAVTRSEVIR
jgi:RNA polymerase sigma factor (sigma-70 family)